jgi:LEA14-like dessication related protein
VTVLPNPTLPRPLLPLVALLLGCALFGNLFEKPRVTLSRVDVTRVSFTGIAANFVLHVDNPNAIGADLARLTYQLTIDGHTLAEGQGQNTVSIPAHGTGEVVLPVSIQFSEFAQSVAAVFERQNIPYQIHTTLGFQSPAGIIDVALESSGSFPAPRLPRVSLGGLRLAQASLGALRLEFDLSLTNPNAFAIPLGALNYRVRVSGADIARGVAPPVELGAGVTQPVHLGIEIDLLRAGFAAARALQSGSAEVAVEGDLDLGVLKLPIQLLERLTR